MFLAHDANFGSFVVHARNQTVWCWSSSDVEPLFRTVPESSGALKGSGDSTVDSAAVPVTGVDKTLAVWARWAIACGALLSPYTVYCRVLISPNNHCFLGGIVGGTIACSARNPGSLQSIALEFLCVIPKNATKKLLFLQTKPARLLALRSVQFHVFMQRFDFAHPPGAKRIYCSTPYYLQS